MGMDVYGKDGKSYFRNNVWWWHPLWDYCYSIAKDIINEDAYRRGHYNDGAGLDAEGASKLAFRLKGAIAEGHTAHYELAEKQRLAALPDETCNFCNGTGQRNDEVVQGECNACDGKGHKRPFDTWYAFSEENVKEFQIFLETCGGFEIC